MFSGIGRYFLPHFYGHSGKTLYFYPFKEQGKAMAKDKTVYVCANCGQESPKWVGRCPACGEWNTFKEFTVRKEGTSAIASGGFHQALPGEPLRRRPIPVGQIVTDEEPRLDMHDEELNRVLGGGLVPGSLVLLGGEPGIGKSTLVLQTVLKMTDKRVLYVSGEESARQLKLRADRLVPRAGGKADGREGFLSRSSCMVVCETSLDQIFLHVRNEQPQLVVIDSIQTIMTEAMDSSPGSISQVRECAALLLKFAKESNIPVILIGHINKEGTLAGPKVLEHIVDAVLQFEGDNNQVYRILRGIKNRFGATFEIGVFEMRDSGLVEVENPSEMLLSGRPEDAPGTCVTCVMEGARPVLAEIQALAVSSPAGNPRRTSNGFDYNRFAMLLAVLEKRGGLKVSACDAYLNIIGGLSLDEPAADLAAVIALASSYLDRPVPADLVAIGEVGLTGELRSVSQLGQRVSEVRRLGFTQCLIPSRRTGELAAPAGLRLIPVRNIGEAIRAALRPSE